MYYYDSDLCKNLHEFLCGLDKSLVNYNYSGPDVHRSMHCTVTLPTSKALRGCLISLLTNNEPYKTLLKESKVNLNTWIEQTQMRFKLHTVEGAVIRVKNALQIEDREELVKLFAKVCKETF